MKEVNGCARLETEAKTEKVGQWNVTEVQIDGHWVRGVQRETDRERLSWNECKRYKKVVLKGYQSNIMTIIGWIQKKKWEDKQTDEWTHKETDRQETQRRQHIRTETSAEKIKETL